MYRTGDIARIGDGGEVEFVGRSDRQVKIDGVRVELGEIESIALTVDGVGQAVATTHDVGGRTRIQLHVSGVPAPHGATEARIRAALPGYARHVAIRFVDRLPMTVNGKFDRRSLTPDDAVAAVWPAIQRLSDVEKMAVARRLVDSIAAEERNR